jgi:hypothetical protein
MKRKLAIIAIMLTITGLASFSQELGVRFGNVSAGHVAVDGVFSVSKFSRVHADVSFGSGVGVDALWDFLYKPLKGEAFNWYLGAGPYVWIDDPFWMGAAGEAGIEYHFNGAPLAIGLDWRPYLSIIETTDFHFDSFGLNVRFVFGKK